MIDKKKFLKILIIVSLIIIIIIATIQIRNTLARYETTTTTTRDVDVAFSVIDNSIKSQRLIIDDIYPINNPDPPFEYTFTVSNFDSKGTETEDDDEIAETDMEYEIVFTATTNLPLTYEISRVGTTDTASQQQLITDSYETVYREMKFGTVANPYPLSMNTIVAELDGNGEPTGKYIKSKITDTYKIKITFPEQSYINGTLVDNKENLEYPDLIEHINIEVIARQKIN